MRAIEEFRRPRSGGGSYADLLRLGRALEEAASLEPLPHGRPGALPIQVDLMLKGHRNRVRIEVENGRLSARPCDTPGASCTVVFSPEAARLVRIHPAAALANSYMSGELRVEGDTRHLMALITLLEEMAPRLGEGSIFLEVRK